MEWANSMLSSQGEITLKSTYGVILFCPFLPFLPVPPAASANFLLSMQSILNTLSTDIKYLDVSYLFLKICSNEVEEVKN